MGRIGTGSSPPQFQVRTSITSSFRTSAIAQPMSLVCVMLFALLSCGWFRPSSPSSYNAPHLRKFQGENTLFSGFICWAIPPQSGSFPCCAAPGRLSQVQHNSQLEVWQLCHTTIPRAGTRQHNLTRCTATSRLSQVQHVMVHRSIVDPPGAWRSTPRSRASGARAKTPIPRGKRRIGVERPWMA